MVGGTLYIASNGSLCSNKNEFIYKEKNYSEYAANHTKIIFGGLAVLLSFFLI